MNPNIRLQNLRDFTVQLRHPHTGELVGAGIVVSRDGLIATSPAVVAAAGITLPANPTTPLPEQEVVVVFPQVGSDLPNSSRAALHTIAPNGEPVVLLRLTEGSVPLAPEQIAVLGTPERSLNHPFRCYGFSADQPKPVLVEGTIQTLPGMSGPTAPPGSIKLCPSQPIDHLAGAAILDSERNLVVGIVAPTPAVPPTTTVPSNFSLFGNTQPVGSNPVVFNPDTPTAWAVSSRILSKAPFGVTVYDMPMRKRTSYHPRSDGATTHPMAIPRAGKVLYDAPPLVTRWVGQEPMIQHLSDALSNPHCQVVGVIGAAGQGKSSLVRRWLRKVWSDKTIRQPESAFWWNFQERGSVDEFLLAALTHLSGTRIDPHLLPSTSMRVQTLGAMVTSRPSLFILDGIETLLQQDSEQYGMLTSPNLREFLAYIAGIKHGSLCVLISRTPIFDLLDYSSYKQHQLSPMLPDEGYTLAQRLGLKGSTETIDEIVAACDAHPLTLCMMSSYLMQTYQGNGDAFLARYRMLQMLADGEYPVPLQPPGMGIVQDEPTFAESIESIEDTEDTEDIEDIEDIEDTEDIEDIEDIEDAKITDEASDWQGTPRNRVVVRGSRGGRDRGNDGDDDDIPFRIPTGIEITIPDEPDTAAAADDIPFRIPTGIEITIPDEPDTAAAADDIPFRIPTGIEITIPDEPDTAYVPDADNADDDISDTATSKPRSSSIPLRKPTGIAITVRDNPAPSEPTPDEGAPSPPTPLSHKGRGGTSDSPSPLVGREAGDGESAPSPPTPLSHKGRGGTDSDSPSPGDEGEDAPSPPTPLSHKGRGGTDIDSPSPGEGGELAPSPPTPLSHKGRGGTDSDSPSPLVGEGAGDGGEEDSPSPLVGEGAGDGGEEEDSPSPLVGRGAGDGGEEEPSPPTPLSHKGRGGTSDSPSPLVGRGAGDGGEDAPAPAPPAARTITIITSGTSTTRAISIPDNGGDASEGEDVRLGMAEQQNRAGDEPDSETEPVEPTEPTETDDGEHAAETTDDIAQSAVAWFCEEYLSTLELQLLMVLSIFRRPVDELAIGVLLRATPDASEPMPFYHPLLALEDDTFQQMLEQLVNYRILTYDEEEGYFIIHPLIHTYAKDRLEQSVDIQPQFPALHHTIKAYYLSLVERDQPLPTLHDLVPAREACYHACQAGAYADAWQIYQDYLCQQQEVSILTDQMGAYELACSLFLEFFPNGDITQPPLLDDTTHCYNLLDQIASCFFQLGEYTKAATCYRQGLTLATEAQNWHIAHTAAYHLAYLAMEQGMLTDSSAYIRQSLMLARQAQNRYLEMMASSLQAWVAHLRGHLVMARSTFVWAELLEREANPDVYSLYNQRGVWYAEHLYQTGSMDAARQITEANLKLCQHYNWKEEISRCYRILADLDSQQGDQETAYHHYQEAIKVARGIPRRLVLIETLLARGLWAARGVGSIGLADDQSDAENDSESPSDTQQRTIAELLSEKVTPVVEDEPGLDDALEVNEDEETEAGSSSRKFWVQSNPETARRFTVARVGTRARTRGRSLRVPLDAQAPTTRGNTGGGWIKLIDGISEQLPFRPERTFVNQIKDRLSASAERRQLRYDQRAGMAQGNDADTQPEPPKEYISAFQVARSSLEEALSLAMAGDYRFHEAAIRLALAYVYMAIGDRETAHTEASYAQQLSNQTGYYRGQTEAAKLLADL